MDRRLGSLLTVYAFGIVGVFLVLAPWSALYRNALLWGEVQPSLADVLASGWFRGVISGVGLLDLAIAVREGRRASALAPPDDRADRADR